jgi:hypothetical protein
VLLKSHSFLASLEFKSKDATNLEIQYLGEKGKTKSNRNKA